MTGRIHSYNDEYFGSVWNYFSFSLLFFSLAPSFVLICTHLNFFFNFFFPAHPYETLEGIGLLS